MKTSVNKFMILPFALICLIFSSACVETATVEQPTPENTNRKMSDTKPEKIEPSKDLEKLAEAVNLAVKPSEAVWHSKKLGNPDNRVPGPTDSQLIAVMKFSDADKAKFEESLKKDPAAKFGNVEVENWFPGDLKEKGDRIPGEKYLVDEFLKSPFSNGMLLKVDDGEYYILKVFTM